MRIYTKRVSHYETPRGHFFLTLSIERRNINVVRVEFYQEYKKSVNFTQQESAIKVDMPHPVVLFSLNCDHYTSYQIYKASNEI